VHFWKDFRGNSSTTEPLFHNSLPWPRIKGAAFCMRSLCKNQRNQSHILPLSPGDHFMNLAEFGLLELFSSFVKFLDFGKVLFILSNITSSVKKKLHKDHKFYPGQDEMLILKPGHSRDRFLNLI
jgi:hypothetical protein